MVVYVDSECKKQQQLVYNVVAHCYEQLIPQYDVDIFITLKPELSDNLDGWCQHNCESNHEFEIAINSNLSNSILTKTVCHEMVHVKQGVRKELVYTHDNKYCRLWKGIEYHHESPWEIEAYKLEEQLFNSFMENYSEEG